MTSFKALMISCSLLTVAACGDSGSGGSGGAGGTDMGGMDMGGSSSGGEAPLGGSSNGAPAAPVLDQLEPVHGALHVYWTNVTPDCDTVHAERKTATAPYAEAFMVPGNVDNKADQEATDVDATYTYRLVCEKGGVMSDYSNELSGSPE
jgi:hypothetical protein